MFRMFVGFHRISIEYEELIERRHRLVNKKQKNMESRACLQPLYNQRNQESLPLGIIFLCKINIMIAFDRFYAKLSLKFV